MKVKFIVTKEIIRKRFEEIAQDIKNRYNIDLEAIYDKYDNHLPYHNKEHAEAVLYYADYFLQKIHAFINTSTRYKNLMRIAAYLHDAGHQGLKNKGKDNLNIQIAKDIMEKEIKPCSLILQDYISLTEFPYPSKTVFLDLKAVILRTADMCQIFIKNIDIYKLCYDLHKNELQNNIPDDEKSFMQQQYQFYESIAKDNKLFRQYFNQHKNKIFNKWL